MDGEWEIIEETQRTPLTAKRNPIIFSTVDSVSRLNNRFKKYWTVCISLPKKFAISANACSTIFSYDSLSLLVPELGIINQKLHREASKQTKSNAFPLNIHCSWGTQFATKFSATKPEINSPKTQIATGRRQQKQGKYILVLFPFCYWPLLEIKYWSKHTPWPSISPSVIFMLLCNL